MGDISIIVATTTNLTIGRDNDIPWNIPSDLKNFKRVTNGKTVIMGRKCWESIPKKYRPLPNRVNIVLSRNYEYELDGAILKHDLESTLNEYRVDNNEIFIIGGAHLYKEVFPIANKLYLTTILKDIDGDVKLEGLNLDEWSLVTGGELLIENGFTYKIEEYVRKK